MAVTALYRISSNEVIKISTKGQPFSDRNPTYWGVLTDPNLPDGNQVRDVSVEPPGALRVVGFAKIAEPGVNTVRNATQGEINSFDAAEIDDENNQDAEQTVNLLRDHPQFRKFTKLIFKAMNQIRSDAALAPWTAAQIRTFIENNVSKDD